MKPCQSNTQCYRVIQPRRVSIQQESIEGRDLYLTNIISDISELVTSSTATESAAIIATNSLVLHAINAGKFRLNMNFWL